MSRVAPGRTGQCPSLLQEGAPEVIGTEADGGLGYG